MRNKLKWTLRTRVLVSFAALVGLLLLISFTAVYQEQCHHLYASLDRGQLELARTELASAIDYPGDYPHLHDTGGEHDAVLFRKDGLIVASTPGLKLKRQQDMLEFAFTRYAHTAVVLNWGNERVLILPANLSIDHEIWMILTTSRTPLESSLTATRRSLFFWGLVAEFIGVLAAWALAGWLTAPLEKVVVLAERVRDGIWNERFHILSHMPEIHSLQSALNTMLDSLQSSLEELQSRTQQQRRFMLDISHELRNPLHALMGTLEVTSRRERSVSEYQEALKIALAEGGRLSKLVQDLLILAQADMERLNIKLSCVAVRPLLEECCQAYQAQAEQLQITLTVDSPPLEVSGNSARLRQILDNLLSNALRYAPPGSTVKLSARLEEQKVAISVSNSGESLSPSQYQEIFERFTRLEPVSNHTAGHVGLGLSIARELAKAQQGSLSAQAYQDGGSVFVLELNSWPKASL